VSFSALVYDMIPVENEDLVERHHTAKFRTWLADIVPVADALLTISNHSRQALFRFAAAARWPMPRVDVIRLGGEWSALPAARPHALRAEPGRERARRPVRPPAQQLPEHYVLFVSTIEIRKNHRFLVRAWRRLIERHGAGAVPVLVFAGQVGWMVDDLLADLDASGWLDGAIEHRPGLCDDELDRVYEGCLFTVFPSLAEGCGLPVAESLAHGKFCLASNSTSIPEVGGDLIDYFDPADEDDAIAKIERVLFEPGYLAHKEARLRARYQPSTWADCARCVVLRAEQQALIVMAAPAGDSDERLASAQPVGNS
jgi:glycosyltransferase involved in cell wall biosynthesis